MNIVDGRRVKTNTWKDFIAPDDEHRFFWGTTGPTRFYHSVRMWLPRDARLGRISFDKARGVCGTLAFSRYSRLGAEPPAHLDPCPRCFPLTPL